MIDNYDVIEEEIYRIAANMHCLEGIKKVTLGYCVADDSCRIGINHAYGDAIKFSLSYKDLQKSISEVSNIIQYEMWKVIFPPFMEFDHQ